MGHLKTQGLPVKVPAHPLAPLGANLVHRDYLEGRIPFQKSPSHSLVDTVSLGVVTLVRVLGLPQPVQMD